MDSNIFDVARISGFSKATVSRAFSSPEKVKDETKKIIYEAAKSINYTPNAVARAMATKRTYNIAFIIYEQQYPVVLNPFYSEIFEAVLTECNNQGYSLFISSDKDIRLPSGELYLKKQMDGVIIAGKTDEEIVTSFKNQNIPVVLLNNYLEMDGLVCVTSNGEQGGKLAIEHIISKGHKKIALIAGNFTEHIAKPRYDAYITALKNSKLIIKKDYIKNIEATTNEAFNATKELISLPDRPTAIVCTNDTIAVGAIKASLRHGLKIPEDIAIIGYDDSDICKIVEPELTSISVEKYEMGALAASCLISQIEGKSITNNKFTTQTKLIKRQTT